MISLRGIVFSYPGDAGFWTGSILLSSRERGLG